MSKDRRAKRIAEVTGVSYTRALNMVRFNEALTILSWMSDDEVRDAMRSAGLARFIPPAPSS